MHHWCRCSSSSSVSRCCAHRPVAAAHTRCSSELCTSSVAGLTNTRSRSCTATKLTHARSHQVWLLSLDSHRAVALCHSRQTSGSLALAGPLSAQRLSRLMPGLTRSGSSPSTVTEPLRSATEGSAPALARAGLAGAFSGTLCSVRMTFAVAVPAAAVRTVCQLLCYCQLAVRWQAAPAVRACAAAVQCSAAVAAAHNCS